jgi:hypothetical protein
MKKQILCILAALAIFGLAAPQAAQAWDFELVVGYFLPEELDEDLTYGLGFGSRVNENWGWSMRYMWFDVSDSQGFGGAAVDADLSNLDFSFHWYPTGGGFSVFGGAGFTTAKIQDVPGFPNVEFSDDVFTVNTGVAYEGMITETFYIKPDFRLRWYELEGFGPNGGKQSQLNYEATVAFGWRFGG